MDIDLGFIKDKYFHESLQEYLEKLFTVKKQIKGIILFGSLARGIETNDSEKISDIDILVIFKDNELPKNHRKRTDEEIELMGLTLLGFDSIWITEKEFQGLIKNKSSFIMSILKEGKILYDPKNVISKARKRLAEELKAKGVIEKEGYWIWPIKHFGEKIDW